MKAGTRGSRLAMVQTEHIIKELSEITSQKTEVEVIKTTGDKIKDSQLYNMDVKGIFTRELDKAVLEGEVDFAVHSLKDLPTELVDGLEVVSIPPRESPREALISPYGWDEIPEGGTLGTSSLRREAFINHYLKNVHIKSVRGNVETRINKVLNGEYHGIILAEAGLKRLRLQEHVKQVFPTEYFTPAAGQGALAIVAREDSEFNGILRKLNHTPTALEVKAEKTVLEELGGGCQWPLGANAHVEGNKLYLYAILLTRQGEVISKVHLRGPISDAQKMGEKAAKIIKEDS
ncbi:MAG TPA: hydroxymethylbilane synthase [Methanobacterium sp.]|nr:MAG: hydroxymethylbilane synthase [Methanobacterium sp.]HOI72294.1 hydroxymethylbilane synthase [Methanobacterium sp.]